MQRAEDNALKASKERRQKLINELAAEERKAEELQAKQHARSIPPSPVGTPKMKLKVNVINGVV